ncbi:MAG: hypothetical protein RL065_823 [Bacteroidota bacterium]
MKKFIFFFFLFFSFFVDKITAQNLIINPGFEENYNSNDSFSTQLIFNDTFNQINGICTVKSWMNLSGSMDGYWYYHLGDIPSNDQSTSIYPHSDSTMVGGFEFFHGVGGSGHCREIMEGKLAMPLIAGHRYQFGIWVQLFDTISQNDIGKIVGINSFSAYFSNSFMPFVDYTGNNLPIQNYTPQVQIWQMVTDTQHWVLLQDTFVAAGGEQYVCIGNFKTDAQIQTQLVDSIRNLPAAAYYYYDDVSLIDITPNGVEELGSKKLELYPNPCKDKLLVTGYELLINTIEVTDVLGRIQNCSIAQYLIRNTENYQLNTENLPSGIYFIKATDTNGSVSVGKFVKE